MLKSSPDLTTNFMMLYAAGPVLHMTVAYLKFHSRMLDFPVEILKEFSLVMLDTRVFLELFFIPFCMLIVSKLSIRYLLTPLRNPATDAQRRYNRAHIQTRNVVERSIGILKRRFPCSSSTLAYQPEKVGKIMTVCAILQLSARIKRNFFLTQTMLMMYSSTTIFQV
jgi:hypothetical protein